jgi:hypothetical protein
MMVRLAPFGHLAVQPAPTIVDGQSLPNRTSSQVVYADRIASLAGTLNEQVAVARSAEVDVASADCVTIRLEASRATAAIADL